MTIQELQIFVDSKPDLRELVNVIVDFIQSNPGGFGGLQTLQNVFDSEGGTAVFNKENIIKLEGNSFRIKNGNIYTISAGDLTETFGGYIEISETKMTAIGAYDAVNHSRIETTTTTATVTKNGVQKEIAREEAGISGTFTTITSITVLNGIITAISGT